MPLDWVEPEIFLEHQDFVVYHTYTDDDIRNGVQSEFWYTLQECTGSGQPAGPETGLFDVRDLPMDVPDDYLPDEENDWKREIMYHIERGYFNDWEHDKPPTARDKAGTPEAKAKCLDTIVQLIKSGVEVEPAIRQELEIYLED